ncbi:MAG: hypothetical protein NT105_00450 [Verrucomicrobia bacterium]|nr:hypothetical protein [Verrucomicrobiota bacterium]
MAYFRSTCQEQLDAEGRNDGNTFKLLLPLSDKEAVAASGTELRFLYCLDDVKGTASLRVSKGDGAFIREFKSSKPYGEDTKVADIYADLNRQVYAWIRNGSPKE